MVIIRSKKDFAIKRTKVVKKNGLCLKISVIGMLFLSFEI